MTRPWASSFSFLCFPSSLLLQMEMTETHPVGAVRMKHRNIDTEDDVWWVWTKCLLLFLGNHELYDYVPSFSDFATVSSTGVSLLP